MHVEVDLRTARGIQAQPSPMHEAVVQAQRQPDVVQALTALDGMTAHLPGKGGVELGIDHARREAPIIGQRHIRSEEHTSELQSRQYLVCRLLLEKKKPPGAHPPVYVRAAAT